MIKRQYANEYSRNQAKKAFIDLLAKIWIGFILFLLTTLAIANYVLILKTL